MPPDLAAWWRKAWLNSNSKINSQNLNENPGVISILLALTFAFLENEANVRYLNFNKIKTEYINKAAFWELQLFTN